jgi:hypothetical protein
MAPADDDNEEPVPWRSDPGRSETRWEPGDYSYGDDAESPVYGAPRGSRRVWLLIALGIALVIIILIVVRYL